MVQQTISDSSDFLGRIFLPDYVLYSLVLQAVEILFSRFFSKTAIESGNRIECAVSLSRSASASSGRTDGRNAVFRTCYLTSYFTPQSTASKARGKTRVSRARLSFPMVRRTGSCKAIGPIHRPNLDNDSPEYLCSINNRKVLEIGDSLIFCPLYIDWLRSGANPVVCS